MGALGLVLGGALGVLGHASMAPRAEPLAVAIARTLVIQLPGEPRVDDRPPPEQVEVDEAVAAPAPALSASAGPAGPAVGRDVDLAAERALLEVARTALARGDSASALAALDQHAGRFPRGRLIEERESLAVQALAASGRRDEAQRRAEQFRRRSPDSMLLPAVEEALEPR
jgi:hypothetical protein